MTGEIVRFPSAVSSFSPTEGQKAAVNALAIAIPERLRRASELHLNEPETLLAICELLNSRMESSPSEVGEDAAWLYRYIEELAAAETRFLFDEREYYLGELAFLAGSANRFQARRDEARTWFDRAEAWFLLTANAVGDVARLAYQRLALKMEERSYEEVFRLAAPIAEIFRRERASESVVKCRFLQAASLRESGRQTEALALFSEVAKEAAEIGSDRLSSLARVAVAQIHAELGDAESALAEMSSVAPVLAKMDNRVGLAKLRWAIGNLFRRQGKLVDSINTFRSAQSEFAELGMKADVAALQLVIGDLLLELGQEAQAEWEIRAALPVIDELKMVPEGVAAFSLLRESVRRRKIDRQALRDLHGYFDEIQG
jgi:hypothetical protein